MNTRYSFIHGVLFDPETVTEPRRLAWSISPEPEFGRILGLGQGSLLPNCPFSTARWQRNKAEQCARGLLSEAPSQRYDPGLKVAGLGPLVWISTF